MSANPEKTALGQSIKRFSWGEIMIALRQVEPGRAWGVPRGGAILAGIRNSFGAQYAAADSPADADFILDDVIDSGGTQKYYRDRFPHLPFIALLDKRKAKGIGWVHFPWEKEPERDIEQSVIRILQYLGQDLNDPAFKGTARRVVESWKDIFGGYTIDPRQITMNPAAERAGASGEMLAALSIPFRSTCPCHILPFHGMMHIAIIPRAGLALTHLAMIELIRIFACRFQSPESICDQIAGAINEGILPKGVAVIATAHMQCPGMAGATLHQSFKGSFAHEPQLRQHFLDLIK